MNLYQVFTAFKDPDQFQSQKVVVKIINWNVNKSTFLLEFKMRYSLYCFRNIRELIKFPKRPFACITHGQFFHSVSVLPAFSLRRTSRYAWSPRPQRATGKVSMWFWIEYLLLHFPVTCEVLRLLYLEQ